MESVPILYEYQFRGGKIFFDFGKSVISLDDGKEFAVPPNLHNFCVVLGGLLYAKEDAPMKAVSVYGKPGSERKEVVLRRLRPKKAKEENTQAEVSANTDGGVQVESKIVTKTKKKVERAILRFSSQDYERTFLIGPPDALALWGMLRKKDKSVGVDDLIFERRDDTVFVQGIPIFYQKAMNLFFVLDLYLRKGELLPFRLEWELGRIDIHSTKKRLGFFRKAGAEYLPAGIVRLNTENILRIMSVV